MAPFFVGIDISGNCLRVAALDTGHETIKVQAQIAKTFSSEEELVTLLRQIFTEDLPRARRVVATVPARNSFFRRLSFPFADAGKISQAIAYELGSHVPIDLANYLTIFQKPVARPDGHFLVSAAAAPLKMLVDILAPFEKAAAPLQVLDLAPFSYAAGLGPELHDCLLVCVSQGEVTVAQVEGGQVSDYRLQPLAESQKIEEIQEFIHSQSLFFKNLRKEKDLSLCIIGSQIQPELIDFLIKQGHRVVLEPLPNFTGQAPEKEFFPALLLAAGACSGHPRSSFNFRQGPLVSKNDWASLKKQFFFSGSIAVLAVVFLIASLALNYFSKAGTLKRLDRQVRGIYQETLPNSKIIVDAPLQMKSHLQELEKKAAVFKIAKDLSPLEIMKEISESLKDVPDLEVRSYHYNQEFVRLEGTTTTFDAVNSMSGNLKKSKQFANVEISEAKMSLDGRHVNFRVEFALKKGATGS